MSRRRNGTNKLRLEKLDEINRIDRRLKKKKIREDGDESKKLFSRRDTLIQQLKISRGPPCSKSPYSTPLSI